MSKPRNHSVTQELVSAMSSLNMPAQPVPNTELAYLEEGDEPQDFLSYTDANVIHAMEHLNALYSMLKKADKALNFFEKKHLLKFRDAIKDEESFEQTVQMFRHLNAVRTILGA